MRSHLLCFFGGLLLCCGNRRTIHGRVELIGADVIDGIVVQTLDGKGGVAVPDSEGSFDVEVKADAVELLVSAESASPPSQIVSAGVGSEAIVTFRALGKIQGVVTRGGRTSGNEGIVVTSPTQDVSITTPSDGRYELTVPTGTQVVRASAAGFSAAWSAPVEVRRGSVATAKQVDLELVGFGWSGALLGRVERLGAETSAGVTVTVEGAGRRTTTADGGWFELGDVPEGIYELRLTYGELSERIPGVLVTRGSDGFLADGSLYRLADSALSVSEATHLQTGAVSTPAVGAGQVVWVQATPQGNEVRFTVNDGGTSTAGRVASGRWNGPAIQPHFSADGRYVIFGAGGDVMVTTVGGPANRVVAHGMNADTKDLQGASNRVSPRGRFAFSGFAPGTNSRSLMVVGIENSEVEILKLFNEQQYLWAIQWFGESLMASVSVSANDRTLELMQWRPGSALRSLGFASSVWGSPSSTFVFLDQGGGKGALIRADTGDTLLNFQRSWPVLSDDERSLAWVEVRSVKALNLETLREETLASFDAGISASIGCALGSEAVGQIGEYYSGTSLVSFSDGGIIERYRFDAGVGLSRYLCTAEQAFYYVQPEGTGGTLIEIPKLGQPPVELATELTGFSQISSVGSNIWFVAAGAVSVTPVGGGRLTQLAKQVAQVLPSPNSRQVAIRADKLYVANADGSKLRIIAPSAIWMAWVSDDDLAFTRAEPPPPQRYQGGVYRAHLGPSP